MKFTKCFSTSRDETSFGLFQLLEDSGNCILLLRDSFLLLTFLEGFFIQFPIPFIDLFGVLVIFESTPILVGAFFES